MSLTPAPATRTLPVADTASVRAHTRGLLRRHRGSLLRVIGLHSIAAVAALVAPRVIGLLVDEISNGRSLEVVNTLALWIAGAVVVQTVVTWFARRASFVMGETVFAELREQFMGRVVELPLSTVERAGTGDLVSRTTNDVEALSHVIRFGVPSIFVGAVTTAITVIAAFVTGWQVALAVVVGVPILVLSTRRYLRYAPEGYLRERATYAVLNGVVTESADGSRTVDALRLAGRRRRRMDDALRDCYDAEIYTLRLRMRWFPSVEFAFFVPVAVTLLWGGWLISRDVATIGTVTAVALYVQQMAGPLDELISWLDEIQVGATSLARVIGIADVPPDRAATGEQPTDYHLDVEDVHYSYRAGRDVLRGVSLDLRPGERLAIVGPSGAGKSTLGRLMAGIDGPRAGRVEVGGVRLVDLEVVVGRLLAGRGSVGRHVGDADDAGERGRPDLDLVEPGDELVERAGHLLHVERHGGHRADRRHVA